MATTLESLPKIGEIEELIVPIRGVVGGEFLVIDAQGIAHLMEKAGDSVGTDADAEVAQRQGNFGRRSTGPPQAGDGIASGIVFEQEFDQSDDVGGFFFGWLASAAGTAGAPRRHIPIEQLLTAASYGVRIQAEEAGQSRVAAVAQFDGFQAGEKAALLLVQQTVEQQDGGLEFIG